MAVRSMQLGLLAAASPQVSTVYTCPSGKTAIVRSVAVYANAAAITWFVGVKRSGVTYYFFTPAPGNAQAAYFDGWVVMEPGDELVVQNVGTASSTRCWVSGPELDGVA